MHVVQKYCCCCHTVQKHTQCFWWRMWACPKCLGKEEECLFINYERLWCHLSVTTRNLKMSKVEKQPRLCSVGYWLWWMDTNLWIIPLSADTLSPPAEDWWSKGLINTVNPLHQCMILWRGIYWMTHLSGNSFQATRGLHHIAWIYMVQKEEWCICQCHGFAGKPQRKPESKPSETSQCHR